MMEVIITKGILYGYLVFIHYWRFEKLSLTPSGNKFLQREIKLFW